MIWFMHTLPLSRPLLGPLFRLGSCASAVDGLMLMPIVHGPRTFAVGKGAPCTVLAVPTCPEEESTDPSISSAVCMFVELELLKPRRLRYQTETSVTFRELAFSLLDPLPCGLIDQEFLIPFIMVLHVFLSPSPTWAKDYCFKRQVIFDWLVIGVRVFNFNSRLILSNFVLIFPSLDRGSCSVSASDNIREP